MPISPLRGFYTPHSHRPPAGSGVKVSKPILSQLMNDHRPDTFKGLRRHFDGVIYQHPRGTNPDAVVFVNKQRMGIDTSTPVGAGFSPNDEGLAVGAIPMNAVVAACQFTVYHTAPLDTPGSS